MEDIGYKIAELVLPLLLAGLTWASAKLASYIRAKIKNEYLRGVLVRLNDAVFVAVKEAQQVAVSSIKAASADGKITEEEKIKIKADVCAVVRSYLGIKGIAELAKILGLDDAGVQQLISSKVEAAVYDIKTAEVAGNPPGLVPG